MLSGLPVMSKDEKSAVVWLQKSAEQGHLEAAHHLALAYLMGRGVSEVRTRFKLVFFFIFVFSRLCILYLIAIR